MPRSQPAPARIDLEHLARVAADQVLALPGQPCQHGVVAQDPALAIEQTDGFRDRVDGQLPLARRRAGGDLGGARAGQRAYGGQQHLGGDGIDQVAVRARLQSPCVIGGVPVGAGDMQHLHAGQRRIGLQLDGTPRSRSIMGSATSSTKT